MFKIFNLKKYIAMFSYFAIIISSNPYMYICMYMNFNF